jgi:hypothetical protein
LLLRSICPEHYPIGIREYNDCQFILPKHDAFVREEQSVGEIGQIAKASRLPESAATPGVESCRTGTITLRRLNKPERMPPFDGTLSCALRLQQSIHVFLYCITGASI